MNRAALAAALLFSSAAPAADFEFGRQGQLVPNGSLGISYQSNGNASFFLANISPDLAYFIADHFALGVAIRYFLQKSTGPGFDTGLQTSAGIEPYGAVDLPLSPLLSFFPRAGVEVLSSPGDRRSLALTAFAPVLLHPAPHFFLGFGPGVIVEVSATVPSTSVAVGLPTQGTSRAFILLAQSIVGGYF